MANAQDTIRKAILDAEAENATIRLRIADYQSSIDAETITLTANEARITGLKVAAAAIVENPGGDVS